MTTIPVEKIRYSTSGETARPFHVPVGDRTVEVRVRQCGESPDDVIRLTIFTRSTDKLPGTRNLAEGRHVSTRQRGADGHTITVTLGTHDNISVPSGRPPSTREIQRFWAEVVDFLDQALPEFTFA